ncbi:hypothetical protein HDV63DRAFT_401618 [Trichoderma sp. SZMC 28014]
MQLSLLIALLPLASAIPVAQNDGWCNPSTQTVTVTVTASSTTSTATGTSVSDSPSSGTPCNWVDDPGCTDKGPLFSPGAYTCDPSWDPWCWNKQPPQPTPTNGTSTGNSATPTGFSATPTDFSAIPTGFSDTPTGFSDTPTGFSDIPTGISATSTSTSAASAPTPTKACTGWYIWCHPAP